MRILITGGGGCLGSNLIEHWAGHDILAIDNFATGHRDVVARPAPALRTIEGTIADRTLVDRAFAEFRPTHVVHAAASYKNPDDWREDVVSNILGTVNVVDAARRAGVVRFVNLQTALCYGRPERIPIPIDHPCRPVTSYAISKTAGENYVALSNLAYASVRLASVIGPRLAIGAIPTFYSRLKSRAPVFCTTAVRDYLDMADFITFMDEAMAPDAPTGLFNLSPGVGHSIKDVLAAVAAAVGVPLPDPLDVRPIGSDDVETVVLDPARTYEAFAWRPRVPFEEAIARTVRWYDQHGTVTIHSHLAVPAAAPAASRSGARG